MKNLWYLGAVLAVALALVVLPAGDLRAAAAFVLLWVLPGWGWMRAAGRYALPERALIGAGWAAMLNVLLTLLLHDLPGPLSFGLGLGAYALCAAVPLLLVLGHNPARSVPAAPRADRPWPWRQLGPLAVLLAIAVLLRLFHLGYSEFQGDEAIVMVRAAAAIEGNDAELFLHQKGPVEILVPLAQWRLSGSINEFWARLPFAWASLLGVITAARLGARWFGRRAGWGAGLLLAINGFHVAFGRIVQYQSWVVWMGLLALLALDVYRERGRTGDLVLGSAFLALGVLAHYDALLLFPAAALLAARWTPGQRWRGTTLLQPVYLWAGLVGAAIVASFYLPFALHPNFRKTLGYLAVGRVRGGPYLNVGRVWVMSTFYNSTYYVILLWALVGLALILSIRNRGAWRVSTFAWTALVVPALFYLVLVFDPRTHVYTLYPAAVLLAGAAGQFIGERARWRWWAWAVGAGLYLLCAGYTWMVFVDHTPEYQRTYPAHKSPLYWTTYDELPAYGRFGFPHRAGWHAIAAMVQRGEIAGWYASNEEQEITNWYTRQAARTHCPSPDVYITAENVQDEVAIDWDEIEHDYVLAGEVIVQGEPRIRWYSRGEHEIEPLILDEADWRQWWRPVEVVPPMDGGAHPVGVVLGDAVRLVGYDLDASQAVPGGWVQVILYWQPQCPLTRNYQVFTHLYDGQLRAQHDGAPECGFYPTTRWEPGEIVADPHRIPLAADMAPGSVQLLVGMYDLLTLDRLPVPGADDRALYLTDVDIRSP
jgi:hypothetical protein